MKSNKLIDKKRNPKREMKLIASHKLKFSNPNILVNFSFQTLTI